MAFTSGAPDHPPDLSIARGARVTRLTRLNDDLFAIRKLASVDAAGRELLGGQAADRCLAGDAAQTSIPAEKYPLILEIHGGPYASYGPVFSTDDQLYAAAGYMVLYTNPRGSTSYGEEFANFIQHDYPSHDYDDLMSAVDAAIAKGSVNPDQLYVTGGSGGGVLTAWIVGKTQRFEAAATQKPVINWASFALTTDIATYVPKYWFGKLPWEDPEGYWKHSPLSLVGNVTTPTLVVVGGEDYRTPRERFGAVLPGASASRCAHGTGKGARSVARRAWRRGRRSRLPRRARFLAWFESVQAINGFRFRLTRGGTSMAIKLTVNNQPQELDVGPGHAASVGDP